MCGTRGWGLFCKGGSERPALKRFFEIKKYIYIYSPSNSENKSWAIAGSVNWDVYIYNVCVCINTCLFCYFRRWVVGNLVWS
jgi:hypothetical protein